MHDINNLDVCGFCNVALCSDTGVENLCSPVLRGRGRWPGGQGVSVPWRIHLGTPHRPVSFPCLMLPDSSLVWPGLDAVGARLVEAPPCPEGAPEQTSCTARTPVPGPVVPTWAE